MDKPVLDDFLKGFDDSRFPCEFLQIYEPLECLKENPEGETLLIKHRQTGKYFIAKCCADSTPYANAAEGRLLRKLHHDGIPAFVEEYRQDGIVYMVREYAHGVPLDRLVRESPLTEQQIISIGVQLCDILVYLHGQSPPVIHRDIKPQNIIVDGYGTARLIDFGISRTYNKSAQTDTVFFGTQEFAPPEQYGFSQTDSRSDIFSFGILLCWLLTGETEVKRALNKIRNKRLAGVVRRCTAFAPEDRFMDAALVRDALTGKATRRRAFTSLCFAAAIMTIMFVLLVLGGNPTEIAKTGVIFEEPLIEQAVRLALSKNDGGIVSENDLLSINELYVFGNKAAANYKEYESYSVEFATNSGGIQRGSISSLKDIAKLKKVKKLFLSYQNINDLTPLSKLAFLEHIELKHNPIQDVSPLAQLMSLHSLFLFDTNVSDLTPLRDCPCLANIDAGYTWITSMAAFKGLDSLQTLIIRDTPIKSLDGINSHPMLEQVCLSGTHLPDLTPLIDLPRLQLMEADKSMEDAVEAIAGEAEFSIIYQE